MTQSPTVAVIDDDDSVRDALRQLLRSAGFQALTFASAEEFLGSRYNDRPDCLVVDINLPGMSGVAMLRALAAQRHVVPAILISARGDAPTRALIRSWPGIPFLRKPFGDDELLAAIAQSLESGGAGQQDIPRKP